MSSPAVGRVAGADPVEVERELVELLPRFEGGSSGAAVIAGSGGSGRGRIVASLQEEAARRDWTVLSGVATPELREVPRGLMLRALRSVLHGSPLPGASDPASGAGSLALSMALVPLLSEELRSTASARALGPASAPLPPSPASAVEWAPAPSVTGADVDAFLLERFRTASEKHPVLLTLEDVEWADDLSFWLLRRLLHRQGSPRVLLLITVDRDEEARVPTGLLVAPSPPFLWSRWNLAGPVPGAAEPGEGAPLGTSAEEDRDQELLSLAAVVGMEFSEGLLAKVSGRPANEVASSLHRSEQRGHLLATEEGFRFPTRAVWTWALGDRPGVVRRRHLKVAQVLEGLHPDPRGRVVFDLARHYEEAQLPGKAFPYLLKCAEAALLSGATREAEDRLRKALTLLPSLPPTLRGPSEVSVYRRLAEADRLLGNVEQGADAMREAIAVAERVGTPPAEVARMEVVLSRLLQELGRTSEIGPVLEAAERLAQEGKDPGTVAEVAARRSILLGLQGRGIAAVAELDRATTSLPTTASPAVRALVHGSAFDLWFMGVLPDLARARAGVRESREGWERAGLPYEVLRTLDHEALMADAAGDWEGALKAYRRLAEEAQRAGFVILTVTGRGNEAETLAELGRLDEAQVALEQARRSLSLLDDFQDDPQVDLVEALIAWKEGRGAQALAKVERALVQFGPGGRADMGDQFLFLKARILHSLGRTDEARTLLEGLPSVNPVLKSPTFMAEWNKILAKAE